MAEKKHSFDIRIMRRDEVPQALDIWKSTGLHEGSECPYTWMEVDPEGFWVAVTESGEVLGVCAGIIHDDDIAFMGMYAVRKEQRGGGIGVKLWKACYDHIGERNAAVNAVPGKKELYRDRGGFPVEEKRWLCVVYETEDQVDTTLLQEAVHGVQITPLTDDELPLALEYDFALVGYRRDKLISLTTKEKDSVSFIATRDGKCVGFGTYKTSVIGHGMVGPLYADSQDIAEAILRKMIENLPNVHGFALLTCGDNEGAKAIADKLGAPCTEECPRLYKNHTFEIDNSKVYGQVDFNFSPY